MNFTDPSSLSMFRPECTVFSFVSKKYICSMSLILQELPMNLRFLIDFHIPNQVITASTMIFFINNSLVQTDSVNVCT